MDIIEQVRKGGVVGSGGAGFPTHVKIDAKVDTILANGAECEPLLYSDQFVMTEWTSEVVDGLKFVMKSTGAKSGILCVKEKFASAIAEFEKILIGEEGISIFKLGNFYPAGDEQILVNEVTGRIVPEGGIPLAVGIVVQNVGTLVNIARAVSGVAVIDRVVTVGGEVKRPGVYVVPIGTSIMDVIDRCGGSTLDEYSILLNGPMMGKIIDPEKEVITKTSGGVILLPKEHAYVRRVSRPLKADIRFSKGACEQCRYCTDFCPRSLQGHALEPHKIMRVINEERNPESNTVTSAFLCCECGVCDLFACPLTLSPRRFYQEFKKNLSERGIKNPHSNSPEKVDVYREQRRVPKDRLTRRLGLSKYEVKPEYFPLRWDVRSVTIPLKMHLGAPATATVKPGDKVKKGDLIGDIPEGLGALVHASISGMVESVNGNVRIVK